MYKAEIYRKLNILSDVVGSKQKALLSTLFVNDTSDLAIVMMGLNVKTDYVKLSFVSKENI